MNDRFGHRYGDDFLIRLANEFIAVWEQEVVYYRLGGDEFFIIVYNHTEAQIIERSKRIIRLVESIQVDDQPGGVSASIGIVPVTEANKSYDTLLDLADGAMYRAKNSGKGQCVLIHDELHPTYILNPQTHPTPTSRCWIFFLYFGTVRIRRFVCVKNM
ncbi:MAG: GGDEF domain-containing protein [Bacillus subtilis]|nr:GGDEF domain-containing protein [Bacillus subtilis]